MTKYTDELLDGLTDEEREALLEEDEGTDEPKAEGDNDEEAEGSEKGEEGKGYEGDAEEANDNGEAGSNGNDADADGNTDTTGDDQPVANAVDPAAPLLVAEVPPDAEAKLKEIDSKKASLVEQFDDGDITAKEYQSQLDALNKEERSIERAVEKAQLAAEMQKQQEVNTWLSQVKDFTTNAHPEYSTSRVRWMALDTFVKEIGSKPENANLSGQEILRMAHERVEADLGAVQGNAKQDGTKPLKGSKAQPPKTLAKVPAADNNDVENSKWAAMDRLRDTDPIAHEEKLMRWSEAERDEYLARS